MTTEYYQIPSQQGFLPLSTSGDSSADPWLAAATNSLSISDSWKGKQVTSPPSLFEPGDAEASVSWKHVVPLQYTAKAGSADVKAPVAPKRFNSTTSKIDAWSVQVVDNNVVKQPKNKQVKQHNNKTQQVKQVNSNKQVKNPLTVEEKPIEDELTNQNISLLIPHLTPFPTFFYLLHYVVPTSQILYFTKIRWNNNNKHCSIKYYNNLTSFTQHYI